METKKTVASIVEVQKNSPALLVLGVILLLSLTAAGFYLFFQKSAIVSQRDQIKTDVDSLQTQINDLKSKKIEAAQLAKNWLTESQKTEIIWSKVLSALQKNVPVDSFTNAPKIHFLSYSGAAGGKLTLNAETTPATIPPFADVSQLINVFNNSAYFQDAYIPSVTKGLADNGQTILSFIFNVTYTEQAPENLTPSLGNGAVTTQPSVTQQTQPSSTTQQPVPRTPTPAPASTPTVAPTGTQTLVP